MIYPRLKVARDLLTDDGVIFISIDDNEVENLKKICDEIFGYSSFIDIFNWAKTETPENLSKKSKQIIEYVHSLVYLALHHKLHSLAGVFIHIRKLFHFLVSES